MRKIIISIALFFLAEIGLAQHSFEWMPLMQMSGIYFSSDRITSDGAGMGAGVIFVLDSNYLAQADINLLWLNGNAASTRLAIGYQRKGKWSPAIFGTFNLLWGHRTEIVNENGERPPSATWAAGARIAPLRFNVKSGMVSLLEFGYGFGPSSGRCLEATLLSISIKF